MWLALALSAAFAFAVVHVMDSFCVDEIFEEPWIGVVTSAVASLLIFFVLPFILPFTSLQFPSTSVFALALFAGILIQASQFFYFLSLKNTEPGIVAAYWNLIPALLPIAGFLLFGNVLTFIEYIGICVLIIGSVLMCLLDTNLEARWSSFLLMLAASLLQVTAYLIEDFIFESNSYFTIFLIITLGIIVAGVFPLFFLQVRISLKRNYSRLYLFRRVFVLIEAVNLLALAFAQKAIDLGKPSLVAAAETTMPAFTFLLGINLAIFFSKFSNKKIWHHLQLKFMVVILMIVGVWLVS